MVSAFGVFAARLLHQPLEILLAILVSLVGLRLGLWLLSVICLGREDVTERLRIIQEGYAAQPGDFCPYTAFQAQLWHAGQIVRSNQLKPSDSE